MKSFGSNQLSVMGVISMSLNDIAILNIGGASCPCIINWISKSEAINLFKNAGLSLKDETL